MREGEEGRTEVEGTIGSDRERETATERKRWIESQPQQAWTSPVPDICQSLPPGGSNTKLGENSRVLTTVGVAWRYKCGAAEGPCCWYPSSRIWRCAQGSLSGFQGFPRKILYLPLVGHLFASAFGKAIHPETASP